MIKNSQITQQSGHHQQQFAVDTQTLQHLIQIFQSERDGLNVSFLESRLSRSEQYQLNLQEQLKYLCNQMQQKQSSFKVLIEKSVEIFRQFGRWITNDEKYKKQQEQLRNIAAREILNSSDKIKMQQQLLNQLEHMNEDLRRRNTEYQDRLQVMNNKYIKQKEQWQQKSKEKVLTLEIKIREISQKNQQYKKQIQMLRGQQLNRLFELINQKDKLIVQLKEEFQKYQAAYSRQKMRTQTLQKKLQQKQNLIQKYSKKFHHHGHREHRERDHRKQSQDIVYLQKNKSQTNAQQQDMNGNLKDDLGSHRISGFQANNFFSFAQVLMQQSQQQQKIQQQLIQNNQQMPVSNINRLHIDPYYAHFVLTSQVVKIKQENEDYLAVDLKPHYAEIIQKRIPMHLWDQWIKNKIKQVLKNTSPQKLYNSPSSMSKKSLYNSSKSSSPRKK